jgi:hypothetical protein
LHKEISWERKKSSVFKNLRWNFQEKTYPGYKQLALDKKSLKAEWLY